MFLVESPFLMAGFPFLLIKSSFSNGQITMLAGKINFGLYRTISILKHFQTVAGTHHFQNENSWLRNGTIHRYVRAVDWM